MLIYNYFNMQCIKMKRFHLNGTCHFWIIFNYYVRKDLNLSPLDKYASLLLSCLYYTFSRIYQEGENIIWSVKKRERYEWSVRCLNKIITIYKYLPHSCLGPSWPWSYGSWIYNYLCNQCLSPLMLWVRIPLRRSVLNTALCDKVCQWLAAGQWFSPPIKLTSTI
jgi:hypothetical protein